MLVKLIVRNLIIAIAIIQFTACNSPKRTIVFSCINCHGCILKSLAYIKNNRIDTLYEIILDAQCFQKINDLNNLKFIDMSQSKISKKFNEFGNILIFDKNGVRTELHTDMKIEDYIN